MGKKTNTVLFILGATVLNVAIAIITFFILFILYTRFLMAHVSEGAQSYMFLLIFAVSVITSFVVYRLVLKLVLSKVDVDKHFDPLFIKKNTNKPL